MSAGLIETGAEEGALPARFGACPEAIMSDEKNLLRRFRAAVPDPISPSTGRGM